MVNTRAFALDMAQPGAVSLDQDWHAVGEAISTLSVHAAAALQLGVSVTGILQWLAVISAIYLLVLNRTGWRTDLLTALLVPYLALELPEPIFGYLRGDIGRWIAFVAVVIRLFFASQFPDTIHGDLELPACFILLIVVTPGHVVDVRGTIFRDIIALCIGGFLLAQHIKNAGGFRQAFAEPRGVSHTIGIILLFVAPVFVIFKYLF